LSLTYLHTETHTGDTDYIKLGYNKYQLSLTNPHDALHYGKRAANKGGRSV